MMKIGIIMGSKNDYEVMSDAVETLKDFGVEYECLVVSAHRTPEVMYDYAKNTEGNNVCMIIAGAGGAAHLPGMVASLSGVPVIGVPVKSSALSGLDSLLSIVQMPKGVPVATMGINQSANAALFAIEVLSINNPELKEKYAKYRLEMSNKVKKDSKL